MAFPRFLLWLAIVAVVTVIAGAWIVLVVIVLLALPRALGIPVALVMLFLTWFVTIRTLEWDSRSRVIG